LGKSFLLPLLFALVLKRVTLRFGFLLLICIKRFFFEKSKNFLGCLAKDVTSLQANTVNLAYDFYQVLLILFFLLAVESSCSEIGSFLDFGPANFLLTFHFLFCLNFLFFLNTLGSSFHLIFHRQRGSSPRALNIAAGNYQSASQII
jgi:hypothetical protein